MAALNTQVSTGVASQLAKQANNTAEPPRRPLVVPPMSAIGNLMCPDEELILAQLHAKRQEVLQVCVCVLGCVWKHVSHFTLSHAEQHA